MPVDPISLQVFKSKFESVAGEMGVALDVLGRVTRESFSVEVSGGAGAAGSVPVRDLWEAWRTGLERALCPV